MKSAESVHWSV